MTAGAWTSGRGNLWLKQSFSFWQTDRKFASSLDEQLTFADRGPISAGERIPFDPATGGTLRTMALTTELRLGVTDWLDLFASLPLLWVDFETTPVPTVEGSFGPGDLLFGAQSGLARGRLALAGRIEVKAPTGGFDPSAYRAPLTEGQWDVALYASSGLSLFHYGYTNAELGWRFRLENPTSHVDPGDQFLFLLEAGVQLPWKLLLKVAADGVVGMPGSLARFGSVTHVPRRRLFSLSSGLVWKSPLGLEVEVGGRFMLAGEDYPSGAQVLAALSYRFRLFGPRR